MADHLETTEFTVEILPGLPGEGPPPLQIQPIKRSLKYAEGLVVKLTHRDGSSWIANFQTLVFGVRGIFLHPSQDKIYVVALGTGYLVNVCRPLEWEMLDVRPIRCVKEFPILGLIVIGEFNPEVHHL